MAHYQIHLAYDGTDFVGLQRQAQGRTVQGEVERALRALGWQGAGVQYAGRTDAGVHALGQVMVFRLAWNHDPAALVRALNAHLPADIVVRRAREVPPDFHPRYQARARRYVYRLYCAPRRNPLRDRYAWRVWPCPQAEALHQAAQALPGRRDFSAFGTPPGRSRNPVRTVLRAAWYALSPDEWAFDVAADAFLYRMVRRLVAAQVEIAQGRRSLAAWQQALAEPPAQPWAVLAPPQGLYLAAVYYDPQAPTQLQQPWPEARFRAWWQALWNDEPDAAV